MIKWTVESRKLSELKAYDHEIWKPIPGLDWYEASSLGRIRSVDHVQDMGDRWGGMRKRPYKGRILKLKKKDSGYLFFAAAGKTYHHVNRAVALAFHGEPAEGKIEAAHLNGVNNDNRPDNLMWCTPRENAEHKLLHGTHGMGSKNAAARLSENDIEPIFRLYVSGKVPEEIAPLFGVKAGTVHSVIQRRRWGHVPISLDLIAGARMQAQWNMNGALAA